MKIDIRRKFLYTNEVEEILNITKVTVYRRAKAGKLPFTQIDGRYYFPIEYFIANDLIRVAG